MSGEPRHRFDSETNPSIDHPASITQPRSPHREDRALPTHPRSRTELDDDRDERSGRSTHPECFAERSDRSERHKGIGRLNLRSVLRDSAKAAVECGIRNGKKTEERFFGELWAMSMRGLCAVENSCEQSIRLAFATS